MSSLKCPFTMIQASGACACEHAQEVVRRGGSEFDCTSTEKHSLCSELVERLNAVALPAMGHEDDLNLTPKSVYERVLLGGLHALGGEWSDAGIGSQNIWHIVATASSQYAAWHGIDKDLLVPAIEACKIKRRRRR